MTMTVDEIVMEYKQAKDPEKQIRIMADQCLCKPSDIRSVLREAGVYQAKVRKPGNQTQPSAPEKAAAQPATPEPEQEAPQLEDIRPITAEPEDTGSVTKTMAADMSRGVLFVTQEKLYSEKDIKASALDAIADMFPYDADEGEVFNFTERVRGVLTFVQQLEGWPRP